MSENRRKNERVIRTVAFNISNPRPLGKCPDCKGQLYWHSSGRMWCDECGESKDKEASG